MEPSTEQSASNERAPVTSEEIRTATRVRAVAEICSVPGEITVRLKARMMTEMVTSLALGGIKRQTSQYGRRGAGVYSLAGEILRSDMGQVCTADLIAHVLDAVPADPKEQRSVLAHEMRVQIVERIGDLLTNGNLFTELLTGACRLVDVTDRARALAPSKTIQHLHACFDQAVAEVVALARPPVC